MEYIIKLDIFSQNVNFTLENNSKIQTFLGGLLTILYISCGISLFIQNGKELFLKENPISFQETLITQNYLNISMNKNSFPITFQVYDNNGNSIDVENKLDILIQLENITSEGVGYVTTHDVTNLNYTFENPSINGSNFIMSQDENVTLSGSWNINNLVTLRFIVSICDNKTSNSCDTRDEIFDYIGLYGLVFNFYYNDVNLQLTNFNSPINTQVTNNYFYLTQDTKYISYYLKKNQIITDSGIIFSEIDTLEYITVDSYSADTSMLGINSNVLFCAYFYSTNKTQIIHRSYLTLQSILSQIAGLLNLLYWVFLFANSNFTMIKKNLTIMNAVFEEQHEKELKVNSEIHKKINLNDISEFSVINKIKKSSSLNNDILQLPKHYINKNQIGSPENEISIINDKKIFKTQGKNILIKFSFKDNLIIICCSCKKMNFSKNLNYYNLLSKIIDYYCDIINYIRKLEDIEKLKKIVLSDQQVVVFNMIKPKIRDIGTDFSQKNTDEILKLLKNITENPRDKIDESIRKFFL